MASEVRVFPLLELDSQKSRHVVKIITLLEAENLRCRIQEVAYEFQKGGNQLLCIVQPEQPGTGDSASPVQRG